MEFYTQSWPGEPKISRFPRKGDTIEIVHLDAATYRPGIDRYGIGSVGIVVKVDPSDQLLTVCADFNGWRNWVAPTEYRIIQEATQ